MAMAGHNTFGNYSIRVRPQYFFLHGNTTFLFIFLFLEFYKKKMLLSMNKSFSLLYFTRHKRYLLKIKIKKYFLSG